jgi:hypothetical protein
VTHAKAELLNNENDAILGMLVRMVSNPDSRTIPNPSK